MSDKIKLGTKLAFAIAIGVITGLTGCISKDVQYHYDVPQGQTSCPNGMNYRDGGPGIVDRDGGAGIVDRDGANVTAYCEEATCPSGNWSTQPAEIDWHQDPNKPVVANRTCLSSTTTTAPPCPASCSNPTPTP